VKRSTFFILCLEGAILSFNVAAAATLVPSIARDLALSQFVVGRITWMYMFPYGIAALIYGPLVRAFDAKKVELICLFCFSLANMLAGLSRDIQSLFLARFLMGVFGASVIPLGLILIAQHVPQESRGRYVGLFFGATFVASLLGLFLSGLIQWRWIFFLPAIAGFLLTIAMLAYLPSFKPSAPSFRIEYLSAFKNREIIRIFTYIFAISLFYHAVQQWLAVYFYSKFALSQFLISMLITLTSLSGVFGEVFGGALSDTLGRVKTVNLGILLMAGSVFLLVLKSPLVIIAFLMVAWGLGWTFNHAGLSTMLTDLPKERLNEAASLNSGVRFIAGGAGAKLGEIILQRNFNLGLIFFGICILILVGFSNKLIAKS